MPVMIHDDGTIMDVAPQDAPVAIAHGFKPFDGGNPAHLKALGVAGPDTPKAVPKIPASVEQQAQGSLAQQHVTGMGVKGPVGDVAGLMNLIPGLNKTEFVKNLVSYAKPATPEEGSGITDYQIGSAALPVAAGMKAAEGVNVAERVIQSRNAAGQFMKGVRVKSVPDLITRGVVRAGTQGGLTALQAGARGQNPTTAAAAGVAGGALAEASPAIANASKALLARTMASPMGRMAMHGVRGGLVPLGVYYEIAHGKMPDMETLMKLGLIGGVASTPGAAPAGAAYLPGMAATTSLDPQPSLAPIDPVEQARRQALLNPR